MSQESSLPLPVVNACWRTIGVQGDSSCVELASFIHCRNCPVYSRASEQLFDREPPAAFVEEWTRQLAQDALPARGDEQPVLIFRTGEEWLALDVPLLIEVAPARTIHCVPQRSNNRFLGLVNIRGELQLCVSLREVLAIDPENSPPPANPPRTQGTPGESRKPVLAVARPLERLLVVENAQGRWAVLVDEVACVFHLVSAELSKVPMTVARGRVSPSQGVFTWQGHRVGYLATDRLFEALQRSME